MVGRLEKNQDYKIGLGREYRRPNGGRQEHAACFDHMFVVGAGLGLK